MFGTLYWILITAISVGLGWLVTGVYGAVFLGLVCVLGGVFLFIEHKIHPSPER